MATILAIDTSAIPVSCAILQEDKLVAEYYVDTAVHHSQTLMPMVLHALQSAGLSIQEVDAFAVSVGPGSFTGVRIGVSSVKGLAFAEDKPCVPVSTLTAMAAQLKGLPMDAVICCVMDARCNQVYTASFMQSACGTQTRLTQDEAITIDELQKRLAVLDKPVVLLGDGATLCYKAMKDSINDLLLAPAGCQKQSATGVAVAAAGLLAEGKTVSPAALQPLYLRLPQAERELRARQQKPVNQ